MDLTEFHSEIRSEVQEEVRDRLASADSGYPYAEMVFTERVMNHMYEVGMTFEPFLLHHNSKYRNGSVRISGYSLSDDEDQLDLFVTLYKDLDSPQAMADGETKTAAGQAFKFFELALDGTLVQQVDPSGDAYELIIKIPQLLAGLDTVRIFVITDSIVKTKQFASRDVNGLIVRLEVMDIERLHRHCAVGRPRDELVVNFGEVSGEVLPCVYVPGAGETDYDYALAAIPGEVLRAIYERYGARLLEANVRSFLSYTGKVNKGIRDTLIHTPNRFMAYNNGIVVVADEVGLTRTTDGGVSISWLKGMQIVNGGQTTATIYFTRRRDSSVDLSGVRVPAKIIVLNKQSTEEAETLVASISRFANTQNAVRASDLSANRPFHIELERLANTIVCPDGVGRWFYERAAGSYNTLLQREPSPARQKRLREKVIPPRRKITKTDVAKYIHAWDQKPNLVSLGAQKNFEKFMAEISDFDVSKVDAQYFQTIIAKAILYKKTHEIVKATLKAFQANVCAYVVSLTALKIGSRLNLSRIWAMQDISDELRSQLRLWTTEVSEVLETTSNGRMISEWAKRPECWDAVSDSNFSECSAGLPEFRR